MPQEAHDSVAFGLGIGDDHHSRVGGQLRDAYADLSQGDVQDAVDAHRQVGDVHDTTRAEGLGGDLTVDVDVAVATMRPFANFL